MTEEDLYHVQTFIELFSLTPLADSLAGKNFATYGEAVSVDSEYRNLYKKAVEFMTAAWGYYCADSLDLKSFLVRFMKASENNLSMQKLENIYDSIKRPVSAGDVLEKLIAFKYAHNRMWTDLLHQNREDFPIGFWHDTGKLAHLNLGKQNHCLVHSVNNLSGDYYNRFIHGVPVSCSVFDVRDPWWYLYECRRTALVYDLSECELLGVSEHICNSVFNKNIAEISMNRLLSEFAMPSLWDFDKTSQFRPYVKKELLIEQAKRHDSNDVGEVVVLGNPCAVIVRELDSMPVM